MDFKVPDGWREIWHQSSTEGGKFKGFTDSFDQSYVATATPAVYVVWNDATRVAKVIGVAILIEGTNYHQREGKAEFFARAAVFDDYTQAILWGQALWPEIMREFWKGVERESGNDVSLAQTDYRSNGIIP